MHPKRTAAIVVAGGALAAWLAAAATSPNRDGGEGLVLKPPAIDGRGAALAVEIARLHERLRPSATPPQAGRDLFAFVSQRPRPVEPVRAPEPALIEAPVRRPAPPALKLSGMAEDAGPEGVVRTAIISGFGQLFLAKEGETVADRYRVAKISPEVVELTDLVEHTTLRLALR
jgi:acetyl esterase/lipase